MLSFCLPFRFIYAHGCTEQRPEQSGAGALKRRWKGGTGSDSELEVRLRRGPSKGLLAGPASALLS
eukprot:jgi/Botrbrau1/3212/Bobra.37_2s0041.1